MCIIITIGFQKNKTMNKQEWLHGRGKEEGYGIRKSERKAVQTQLKESSVDKNHGMITSWLFRGQGSIVHSARREHWTSVSSEVK